MVGMLPTMVIPGNSEPARRLHVTGCLPAKELPFVFALH